MANTAEELLDESLTLLEEKKTAQKTINTMAKDASAALGVPASVIKKCKDLYFTKGKAWNGGPLSLDKDEKVKDKISQVMIKLVEVIQLFQNVGHVDWLDDYISALEGFGIHLSIDDVTPLTSDPDETEEIIKSMLAYQAIIKDNTEMIREDHGTESENLNFAPKKDYSQVVSFYNKVKDGKDVDDEYQDKVTALEMLETAMNLIYDGRPTPTN